MRDFIHRFYPYQALKLMLQRHQLLPTTNTTTYLPSLTSATQTPSPPFDPVQARAHLVSYFSALKQKIPVSSRTETEKETSASTRHQITQSLLGFYLTVRPSKIPNSGLGVFLNDDSSFSSPSFSSSSSPSTTTIKEIDTSILPAGTIVALYPGTLYRPGEAIFFNSLRNRYILKCNDGIFVDGKPIGLSGSIYRSANGRDNFPGCVPTTDTTWMVDWTKTWSHSSHSSLTSSISTSSSSKSPLLTTKVVNNNLHQPIHGIDTSRLLNNPLAVGQIVNNGTAQFPPNVRYQELDIQTCDLPLELQEFLPNIWYSGDWHSYDYIHEHDSNVQQKDAHQDEMNIERAPGSRGLDRLRTVVLVTTRPIQKDEELYSTYIE